MFLTNTHGDSRQLLRPALMVALIGLSAPLFAAPPTTGQLIVINGVASVVDGTVGNSASSVKVVVNDSVGPCYTAATVLYKGNVVVTWDASKTHSTTVCTGVTSVDITALKTATGVVQYDSTANATPPAVATAATTFTAPTTAITNLALIATGGASSSSTGSATSWSISAGTNPVYDTNNGSLATTGVMGGVGSSGLRAERLMRSYAVVPLAATTY